MSTPAPADAVKRRKEARGHVYTIGALVTAEALGAPVECVVRDMSALGARLEVERDPRKPGPAVELPDEIRVYFCPTETAVNARVTWRDGLRFGVAFDGEPCKAERPA